MRLRFLFLLVALNRATGGRIVLWPIEWLVDHDVLGPSASRILVARGHANK